MNYNNGRPVLTGAEVINAINPQRNRVILIPEENSFKPINPHKVYDLAQLFGRNGKPAVVDSPERGKGGW